MIKCIESLTNSTAASHDTLSNKMVKYSKYRICEVLASITNNCFKTGKFPNFWKLAKVKPLHKKGVLTEAKNYRPIALLCSLSKVVERAVSKQIISYLGLYGFYDKRQYGYRSGHSTNHAILDLLQVIIEAKNTPASQYKINTLMLDLSAAFDLVDHELLLLKLKNYGFGDLALSFVRSYLTGRSMEVKVGIECSKRVPITCGVPQGSVLGPLLYTILISDIQDINNHPKILYADDTSCAVVARGSAELEDKTNAAMRDLVNYYHNLRLKLNASKTEIINHNTKNALVDVVINSATGEVQTSVPNARLLGMQIDADLSFKKHIDNLVRDVKYYIKMFNRLPEGVSLRAKRTLGIGLLISRITFGISVYASASNSDLRKVRIAYHDCLRAIIGKKSRTRNRKMSLKELHRSLALPTFHSLVKYFDAVSFKTMLDRHEPHHLYKHINQDYIFQTRASNNQIVKIKFIPRNEKSKRSYLVRAVKTFNSLPTKIRKLRGESFKKAVKKFLYERDIQDTVSCKLS